MSSYLLAFCIGEFDYVQGATKEGRVGVRVYTPPGKSHLGTFALEVAEKTLDLYDSFFQERYPLPKLDMVAIPEFAMGAMENWGLVTYREVDLLIDEVGWVGLGWFGGRAFHLGFVLFCFLFFVVEGGVPCFVCLSSDPDRASPLNAGLACSTVCMRALPSYERWPPGSDPIPSHPIPIIQRPVTRRPLAGPGVEPTAAARVLRHHARAGPPVVWQPCHHAVVSFAPLSGGNSSSVLCCASSPQILRSLPPPGTLHCHH